MLRLQSPEAFDASPSCPHCGAALPAVADAFCPECRNSLQEPTPTAGPETPGNPLRLLLLILGVVVLLPDALAFTRGNWSEDSYAGGAGILLVLSGLLCSRPGSAAAASGQEEAESPPGIARWSARSFLVLAGGLVGLVRIVTDV
jgi:hypothetical protein